MSLHEVENPLLEAVEHAEMHWIEEVSLREIAHNPGNISKHVESFVTMMWRDFGTGCIGVHITESSI